MDKSLENILKACLLKFEQYDYFIEKICIQFGINNEAMTKEAHDAAKERLDAKLKDQSLMKLWSTLVD